MGLVAVVGSGFVFGLVGDFAAGCVFADAAGEFDEGWDTLAGVVGVFYGDLDDLFLFGSFSYDGLGPCS